MKDQINQLQLWLTDQWYDDADRDDYSKQDWLRGQLQWLVESKENFEQVIAF